MNNLKKPSNTVDAEIKTDQVKVVAEEGNSASEKSKPQTKPDESKTTDDSKKQGKRRKRRNKKGKKNKSNQAESTHTPDNGKIANTKTGNVSTSSKYKPPGDANTSSDSPRVESFVQSIEVQDLKKNATVSNGIVDSDAFNNNFDQFSDMNGVKPDLSKVVNKSAEFRKLVSFKKKMFMHGPQTVLLPYSSEELETKYPTYLKHNTELNDATNFKTNAPFMPQVISVLYTFIYAGGNPEVLKPYRDDIKFAQNSFVSEIRKDQAISYFVNKKLTKVTFTPVKKPVEEFNGVLARSGVKPSLIDSHQPKIVDEQGDLSYTLEKFSISLNSDLKGQLDRVYTNDISTIRIYNSLKQFISNLINITLDDPVYSEFRGLSRNNEELIHFTYDLIAARTFIEILFYCVSEVQNRAEVIIKKTGFVDPGLKHVLGSRVLTSIQNQLRVLAEYFSQVPYDKRIVTDAIKALEWGTSNELDPFNELNSIISPVLALAGNILPASEFKKKGFSFREHVASSAIEIKNGGILAYMLSSLRTFLKFDPGFISDQSFSESNVAMYPQQIDGNNKEISVKDIFLVSATRMTNSMTNFLESLPYMTKFFDDMQIYFQGSAQFFRLFKAKGLFDGTDFAIDECKYPVLGEFSNKVPALYPNMMYLSGFHLGSNLSQVQLLTKDRFDDPTFLPSWRLFIPHGADSVDYQNVISHLIVSDEIIEHDLFAGSRLANYVGSKFSKPEIEMPVKLESVYLYDCTLIPFVPFGESIIIGHQSGALALGEIYNFKKKISEINHSDKIQFVPRVFEWSGLQTASTYNLNQRPSALPIVNHPTTKYYFTTSYIPFLLRALNRQSAEYSVYSHSDLLFQPEYLFGYDSDVIRDLFISKAKPIWSITVAHLFVNKLFNGLGPLARGRSFNDLPTLNMCKLGEDS